MTLKAMSVVYQLPNLDIGIDNLLKIAKLTKLDLEFWVDKVAI